MTHDILQCDIDLARQLLDAGRSTNEIVAALTYRGIDSNRATQLVADLQSGKAVQPDKPLKINLGPNPAAKEGTAVESKHSRTDLPAKRSEDSRSKQRKASAFPWFTIVALTASAVCIAAFVLISRKSHTADSLEQDHSQAADNTGTAATGSKQVESRPGLAPKSISLEVKADGLRLCGNSISSENFLARIFTVLGAPTRTNQVEKVNQVIYAYDTCGLLVYSPKDSGHYSIVLDFDASDGAAGTRNAFVGTLKINNQFVGAGTDAITLASIKELGLQTPKSASGIYHAQYGAIELVFGYLKSPGRLSLVEIDFK